MADVGEGVAGAEIHARTGAFSKHQQRRVLARVVRTGKRRIVSVIRCDHHEIIVTHRGFNLRQTRVEVLERFRVTFRVAAMPVKHVEVNKVREDQSPRTLVQRRNRLHDRLFVVLRR